ncbi:MAG TPA: class I adenylate-forming enzyme family protein [Micromonosporaceae bacterium]
MIVAADGIRRALHAAADCPLLVDTRGDRRTGHSLAERIGRVAGELARRGLRRRRIGVWYENSLAAFEAFLAVEWLGGTRIPVDPGVPASEARAVFEAAEVDAVLADCGRAGLLGGDVLVHDDESPLSGPLWSDEVRVPPETALVVYPRAVSGGQLFGVATSYRNWTAIMDINRSLFHTGRYGTPFGDDECFLTVQQLMHGTGMVGSFPFLLMGLPQVVLPRFDPDAMLEVVSRHRVTATFTVPGMLSRLADLLQKTGQSGRFPLRHTLYGGAPIDTAEIRRLLRLLGPSLVQLYGRFEAGWPLAVLDHDDHAAILAGDDEVGSSCGRPVPEVELRFRPLPGGSDGWGELRTRNGMVAQDYSDPDGWCSLGDVASIDHRGYLRLAGRLDRMINTGSYHVYPEEVEEAIVAVPGVKAVRVTGEPDPVWGQVVTAYLVAEETDDIVATVRGVLLGRLAKYKVPKVMKVVDRLD